MYAQRSSIQIFATDIGQKFTLYAAKLPYTHKNLPYIRKNLPIYAKFALYVLRLPYKYDWCLNWVVRKRGTII